jgi:hypothetical protein
MAKMYLQPKGSDPITKKGIKRRVVFKKYLFYLSLIINIGLIAYILVK